MRLIRKSAQAVKIAGGGAGAVAGSRIDCDQIPPVTEDNL